MKALPHSGTSQGSTLFEILRSQVRPTDASRNANQRRSLAENGTRLGKAGQRLISALPLERMSTGRLPPFPYTLAWGQLANRSQSRSVSSSVPTNAEINVVLGCVGGLQTWATSSSCWAVLNIPTPSIRFPGRFRGRTYISAGSGWPGLHWHKCLSIDAPRWGLFLRYQSFLAIADLAPEQHSISSSHSDSSIDAFPLAGFTFDFRFLLRLSFGGRVFV